MASSGDEITYTYSGAKETEDVSDIDEIIIRQMDGADGRTNFDYNGGKGGQITNARLSLSGDSTLEIFVGEKGGDGSNENVGGWGRSDGGDGGGGIAGGGGGSTELLVDGRFVAAADAGGGAGSDAVGGGGGARGGLGGDGDYNGRDAEGSGFGGDGGNKGENGENGGSELGSAQLLDNGNHTNGGYVGDGDGQGENGEIVVAFDKPFPPTINSLSEDLNVVGPSVAVGFSSETGIERTKTIYRSDVSSPTFPDDFTEVGSVGEGVTAFTDSPPGFETTYTYRVTASVNGGESDPSDPETITTSSAGELVVTLTGTNSPVTVGDTLDLDVEVENVGDYRAEETIDADLEPQ